MKRFLRGRTAVRPAALVLVLALQAGLAGLSGGTASANAPSAAPPSSSGSQGPARKETPGATGHHSSKAVPSATPERERAHIARLDAAIAPVRNLSIPADELAAVRDAVRALDKEGPAKAAAIAAGVTHPAARKLVTWSRLRAGHGTAREIRAFLEENPAWPDRTLLTGRLEEGLFAGDETPAAVLSWFQDREPQGPLGLGALASAHLSQGNGAAAKVLIAKAWREYPMSPAHEAAFLARFGRTLTVADHKRRLDRLLVDDLRWKAERSARAAAARRTIALLPPAERQKAEARLAVFLKSGTPKKLLEDHAAEGADDAGLLFHRVQALRRAGRSGDAARLVLGLPAEVVRKAANPDGWWGERRALAYDMLGQNKAGTAYDLVRDAGPLSVNPAKEQAFMAGWIALRYLGGRNAAKGHFTAMQKHADGPLSRAKAAYWLGRTAEAEGDAAAARKHYAEAARYGDTFHGLLARQKLEPGPQPIGIPLPAQPAKQETARFNNLDAVQAAVIARKAGLDLSVVRAFLFHLASVAGSEAETGMTAHLAEALGDTQTAVRIGKAAVARGQNLLIYSYPVHPFPAYKPLRPPPETAFLLGVARQESEFNTLTVSGAGAKGLLQVMSVTAKHVCRDYKIIPCELSRLLTDKPYNAMLASAYIGDRMGEFSGSYVLALAGYNAGPGRARQWIREFGDPRDPKVDPIDWIERIPFQETREYVAKVLSNIQIYRARLGEPEPLRLAEDLSRGVSRPPARTRAASGE